MAVNRQYIGSRYVPLFFENPYGNGNEWVSGIAYEPLIIVTYLNNSYTSKKTVPANVGNPKDNPDYWVMSANYNAQVEQYRKEVVQAKQDIDKSESQYKTDMQNQYNTFSQNTSKEVADFKTDVNERISNFTESDSNPSVVGTVEEMSNHNRIYVLSTNMHIYYWDDNEWKDTTLVYGSGAGVVQTTGNSKTNVMSQDAVTNLAMTVHNTNEFTNADDFTIGTYVNVMYRDVKNLPRDDSFGTLISFSGNPASNFNVQMFYDYSDGVPSNYSLYYRVKFSYKWSKWNKVVNTGDVVQTTGTNENVVMSQKAVTDNAFMFRGIFTGDDANNAPFGISNIITSSEIANLPEYGTAGTLIYMGECNSASYGFQIYIAYVVSGTQKIYYRPAWNNRWEPWVEIMSIPYIVQTTGTNRELIMSQDAVTNLAMTVHNTNEFTNADDFTIGTYVNVMYRDVKNLPRDDSFGTLISFSGNPASNFNVQMFYDYSDGVPSNYSLYYRVKFSYKWSKWNKVVNTDVLPVNDAADVVDFYDKKIVLGGDSITHGQGGTGFAQDGETIIEGYKRNTKGYCWAKLFTELMSTYYNSEVTNNGCTGTHSKFWAQNIATLLPENTDIFMLSVGINDRLDGDADTVKQQVLNSVTTINDYCKAHNITFLCFTPIPDTDTDQQRSEVKAWQIAEFFKSACAECNVRFYDLYNAVYYFYFNRGEEIGSYADGLHPNDLMYYYMFYLYCQLLNIGPGIPKIEKPN